MLVAAAQKTGRIELAHKALDIVEGRLSEDQWPEYYDGKNGRLMEKRSKEIPNLDYCWVLVAQELIANPAHLGLISFEPNTG